MPIANRNVSDVYGALTIDKYFKKGFPERIAEWICFKFIALTFVSTGVTGSRLQTAIQKER